MEKSKQIPLEAGLKNLESVIGKPVIAEVFNATFEYHGDSCSAADSDVSGEVELVSGILKLVRDDSIKIGQNEYFLSYRYSPIVETSSSSGAVTLVVHSNKVIFDCYYETIPYSFKHKLNREGF